MREALRWVTFIGMNNPRVDDEAYVQFLVATPVVVSALEAERVQPDVPKAPSHDAFTRFLHRHDPDSTTLWNEVAPLIARTGGVLVLDDSTLDKPRARQIDLVGYHWSGNHHAVVRGINLLTLLWSDGDRFYPCDFRIYHKPSDGFTKNDHFETLLRVAKSRGFQPDAVLFDSWYASVENLKLVREFGWSFVTRLKANRMVRIDRGEAKAVSDQPIAATGTTVWLPAFGLVRVFRVVAPNGDTTHWVTNELEMEPMRQQMFAEWSWSIEEYHRGLKQFTGVEKCQVRSASGQRNHVGCAIRAFVRLEYHRFTTGMSWFDAKMRIIRDAVRAYLSDPLYRLPNRATA